MTTHNKERAIVVKRLIKRIYDTQIDRGLLTVSTLCNSLGVSRATFYNWRNGRSSPMDDTFEKLLALVEI